MLPPFSSSKQRTSGSRQPMPCLTGTGDSRSRKPHGLGPGWAAAPRRGGCAPSTAPRPGSRLAERPTRSKHDHSKPVTDNQVEYVDSSWTRGASNEKLTNNATGVASPPDTATDRDSRLPPSNHTRTCNKLPDVYM